MLQAREIPTLRYLLPVVSATARPLVDLSVTSNDS